MSHKLSALTLLLLSLLFFYSCEQKDEIIWQTESNNKELLSSGEYIENVVRLKFSGQTEESLKFSLKSGRLRSDNKEIDRVMISSGIKKLTRTFPPAGRFEMRTRKEGLHLWYDVTFDTSLVSLKDIILDFGSLNDVEAAEPIRKISLAGDKKSIPVPLGSKESHMVLGASQPMPFNDPFLSYQWHYYNDGSVKDGLSGADINLFAAWLKETGSPEVIVSVVDGGIDFNHEDLRENMWVNVAEYNGSSNVDDDNNGYVDDVYGYNFVDGKGVINAHDHGTHVAGTIGAVNNNGVGVCGIAGGNGSHLGVRLMSCQVFSVDENGEEISAQNFEEAIKYGADNGAVISQNSWGYEELDYMPASMQAAIDYFNKYAGVDENDNQTGPMDGGVVIFASGNDDREVAYPASYDGVVSVAAMAPDFTKAYYSNYGSWIDITAPGGTAARGVLYGTECMVASTLPGNEYGYMQGTSMACPHISGVVALIISKYGDQGFTPELLMRRLLLGSVDIHDYNRSFVDKLGAGLVNAAGGLANVDNLPPEPVSLVDASVFSNTAKLQWAVSGDPDDIKPYGYYVYYSTQPFNQQDVVAGSELVRKKAVYVGQLNVNDPILYSLTHLDFETTYYIAIAGFDYLMATSELSPLVTVLTGTNSVPVITPKMPFEKLIKAHETARFEFIVYDPDNQEFTWSFLNDSYSAFAKETADGISITVNGLYANPGDYITKLVATDEFGASTEYVLSYTVLPNHPPVLTRPIENVYLGDDYGPQTINPIEYFSDVDGETLSYSVSFKTSMIDAVINDQMLLFNALSKGLSDITITARDARGEVAKGSFKVMVRDNSQVVDLYPNPVVDYLNIRMGEDVSGTVKVEVLNSSGVNVVREELTISPFAPARIDLSNLSSGSYIIRVLYNDIDVKRNFIKL